MRPSLPEEGGRLLGPNEIAPDRVQWRHFGDRHITPSSSSSSSFSSAATEVSGAPSSTATSSKPDVEKDSKPPKRSKVRWRDLPNKRQLFILSLCRLSEPLSNVCLLPYIFYLVRSALDPKGTSVNQPAASSGPITGISPINGTNPIIVPAPGHAPGTHGHVVPADSTLSLSSKISLISGLLVSVFPLSQMLVSLPWGRLSDLHGRRPSILLGLFFSVLSNFFFGLSSHSIPLLFLWRAVAGAANGNVALMRTMTAEIVKERKYQTRAFLLLPLVFNSGMIASLALGGILADPKSGFPGIFGPGGVFEGLDGWLDRHPYVLPSFMNAGVLGTVLVISALGLKETLAGKENREDWGLRSGQVLLRVIKKIVLRRTEGYQALSEDEHEEMESDGEKLSNGLLSPTPSSSSSSLPPSTGTLPPPSSGLSIEKTKPPSLRSLLSPKLTGALVSFALLPLHNNAFMHLFPLYLSTPPPSSSSSPSGLHWSGGLGLPSSTIGPWLSIFGIMGILLQLFIYPRLQARLGTLGLFRLATLAFPLTYALVPFLSLLSPQSPGQYVLLALVSAGQILARTIAIPSTVILLTEAAPEKRVLGTVHGAGNTAAALARAVGPAVGGAVYAAGVRMGVMGLVWWVYLAVVSAVAAGWAFGYQKVDRRDEAED